MKSDVNTAGASARREGERRHEPSFIIGASGEERVGHLLDSFRYRGVRTIHDRKRLRADANIDHIAVAPAGVFVVDTKLYSGPVRREFDRENSRPVTRLRVDRRDCTRLVGKVRRQMVDICRVLAEAGVEKVPVWPVLCFVDADWGPGGSFRLDRVLVTSPEGLCERLLAKEAIDSEMIPRITKILDSAFLPA